eukprot:Anaeramoba_flamelloidesa571169_12.p1 GENE.a571169_12~~a571169_12.p1  ORF type:complete len:193 (+),score=38.48 a571169_12:3-581(+)
MIKLVSSFDQIFTNGNNYLLSTIFLILSMKKLNSEKSSVKKILSQLDQLDIQFAKKAIFYFTKVFELDDEHRFLKAFSKVYSKCFAGKRQFIFQIHTLLMFLSECPLNDNRFRILSFRILPWVTACYGNIWSNAEYLQLLNFALLFSFSQDQELAEFANKFYSMLLVFSPELKLKHFPSLLKRAKGRGKRKR